MRAVIAAPLLLPILATAVLIGVAPTKSPSEPTTMYAKLETTIKQRTDEFKTIPAERRKQLDDLAGMIRESIKNDDRARLVFICTHNSRRSHLAQIWAAVAARHYSVAGIHTYSGGTESTAFNPRAVVALERAGFKIARTTDDANPIYHVRFSDDAHPLTCFSKVYDQAPNPKTGFIAVMTCGHADEACPVVRGAAQRIAITYEDPKFADGTPEEASTYNERCEQIAREMLYVFSCLRS